MAVLTLRHFLEFILATLDRIAMAKRLSDTKLNQENWDEEEKKEEAGTFLQASPEVLEERVIKQARRKLTSSDGEESYFSVCVNVNQ